LGTAARRLVGAGREEGRVERVDALERLRLDRIDRDLDAAQALDEEDQLDDVERREQSLAEDRSVVAELTGPRLRPLQDPAL
jgi:hypothetical protein